MIFRFKNKEKQAVVSGDVNKSQLDSVKNDLQGKIEQVQSTVNTANDTANTNKKDISDIRSWIGNGNGVIALRQVEYKGASASVSGFTMTAPNVQGYTFLCWTYTTAVGRTAVYAFDAPNDQTTKCWFVAGDQGAVSVWGTALYVKNH